MRGDRGGFFHGWGGAEQLLDRYFECARLWHDFDHILALPPRRLRQYLAQAERITRLEAKA